MTQLKKSESAHKWLANQRMGPWSLFLMARPILSSIVYFFLSFLWAVQKIWMELLEYFIDIMHQLSMIKCNL